MRLPFLVVVVVTFVAIRLLLSMIGMLDDRNNSSNNNKLLNNNNHNNNDKKRFYVGMNSAPFEKNSLNLLPVADDDDEYESSDVHDESTTTPTTTATPNIGQEEEEESSENHYKQPHFENLRLVFMGDSLTRYQYLSLAYFLRFGRWFDTNVKMNNLVNAHSFHHPLHPTEDWNEFFLQSNRILHPLEVCDCFRSHDGSVVLERRYFYDPQYNNLLVYINMNGKETSLGGRGYYGRLEPENIFGPGFSELEYLPFGMDATGGTWYNNESNIAWDFPTWGDVIRYHVASLDYDYNTIGKSRSGQVHVLLNAGLHPHDFRNISVASDIQQALVESSFLHGIWKTTTYPLPDIIAYQAQLKYSWQRAQERPYTRRTDTEMCRRIGSCFNVSWTALLKPELYFDDLHFLEPVYRVMNEVYLAQLQLLPENYKVMNRSSILIDYANQWIP